MDTNFTLSPSYSFPKSSYHKSHFWAYLYSANTQHGNLPPTGLPILFCGPAQETCVSHSQQRKIWERFRKQNASEWTGRVERSKEEIPGSKRSIMAIYWPTPGFKGRTFKLFVPTRWDFNFCIRSYPLRGTPSVCWDMMEIETDITEAKL